MPGTQENTQNANAGDDVNGQTEKTNAAAVTWESLTPDEKINRLRLFTRGMIIEHEILQYQINKLKEKLAGHAHNKYDEVIYVTPARGGFDAVPEDVFKPDQQLTERINSIRSSVFF